MRYESKGSMNGEPGLVCTVRYVWLAWFTGGCQYGLRTAQCHAALDVAQWIWIACHRSGGGIKKVQMPQDVYTADGIVVGEGH
jgi:hypothetical protein